MPGLTTQPPFPHDVPTHPLLIIDYALVRTGDVGEIDKLWKAATQLGFWYLKNHGVDAEVNAMFDMGANTMDLPLEEKMRYDQGTDGGSFGYKAAGTGIVDEKGTTDTTEILNISKDDALAWPKVVHHQYPPTAMSKMESVIQPFVRKSLAINNSIIAVLNAKLGLPEGTLARLHRPEEVSSCAVRLIKAPPYADPGDVLHPKVTLFPHTDFGSLSFLHNRLGGLQVLPPGATEWFYVKPIPGHAICNIGDALHIFSGGILRSNIHRVVSPPREQAKYERWSLVFFTRPEDAAVLRALVDESPIVAEAAARKPSDLFNVGVTSKDWIARRIKGGYVRHFKGAESWKALKGTEDADI